MCVVWSVIPNLNALKHGERLQDKLKLRSRIKVFGWCNGSTINFITENYRRALVVKSECLAFMSFQEYKYKALTPSNPIGIYVTLEIIALGNQNWQLSICVRDLE